MEVGGAAILTEILTENFDPFPWTILSTSCPPTSGTIKAFSHRDGVSINIFFPIRRMTAFKLPSV